MPSSRSTFDMRVPVRFRAVRENIIKEVFSGEYEAGYSGVNLRVLDIGANVGAFSLWALHRWPGCSVDAYEPHPGTFELLRQNTEPYPMIRCHHAAISSVGKSAMLFNRGAGDGGAALMSTAAETYSVESMSAGESVSVPLAHPRDMPQADVVKIDVEGSEADIVLHRDWSSASLILLEFQIRRNLDLIQRHLEPEFALLEERALPWSEIMIGRNANMFHESLRRDFYGTAFFLRREQTRMFPCHAG
jgi:FkbM family methyltransferase